MRKWALPNTRVVVVSCRTPAGRTILNLDPLRITSHNIYYHNYVGNVQINVEDRKKKPPEKNNENRPRNFTSSP